VGLDVYLYYYKNYEDTTARELAHDNACEALWKSLGKELFDKDDFRWNDYKDLPEKDKKRFDKKRRAAKKVLAKQYGMVTRTTTLKNHDYRSNYEGSPPLAERRSIELPSAIYPEHMFKIGYFRSNYNSGGVNSVLRDMGIPDLYEIFPEAGLESYAFSPDWEACRSAAEEALDAYDGAFDSNPYAAFREEHSSPYLAWALRRRPTGVTEAITLAKETLGAEEFSGVLCHSFVLPAVTQGVVNAQGNQVAQKTDIVAHHNALMPHYEVGTLDGVPPVTHPALWSVNVRAVIRGHRVRLRESAVLLLGTEMVETLEKAQILALAGNEQARLQRLTEPPTKSPFGMPAEIPEQGELEKGLLSGKTILVPMMYVVYDNPEQETIITYAPAKNDLLGGSFSNADGLFSREGIPTSGVYPHIGRSTFGKEDRPMLTFVRKKENEELLWYRQALEIVQETCEWVLKKRKPENYYLHWSS